MARIPLLVASFGLHLPAVHATMYDLDVMKHSLRHQNSAISSGMVDADTFTETAKEFLAAGLKRPSERLFIEYRKLPTRSRIFVLGDRHGDAGSVLEAIDQLIKRDVLDGETLRLKHPEDLVVLLGDYINKGPSGIEVLWLAMELKRKNSEQVVLIRGNHDDWEFSTTVTQFQPEVARKLPGVAPQTFQAIFGALPVALMVEFPFEGRRGTMLFTHGFVDHGFDPQPMLQRAADSDQKVFAVPLDCLDRGRFFGREHLVEHGDLAERFSATFQPLSPSSPYKLGFAYANIGPADQRELIRLGAKDKLEFGPTAVARVFENWSTDDRRLLAVFRGHQHADPQLRALLGTSHGLYCHFCETQPEECLALDKVYTLSIASRAGHADPSPDALLELRVGERRIRFQRIDLARSDANR